MIDVNLIMSKAKITIDGPSFYAKIGRFYEKWSESDEFETFIFILGKVVDQDSQGQKKTQMLHSWLMSYQFSETIIVLTKKLIAVFTS